MHSSCLYFVLFAYTIKTQLIGASLSLAVSSIDVSGSCQKQNGRVEGMARVNPGLEMKTVLITVNIYIYIYICIYIYDAASLSFAVSSIDVSGSCKRKGIVNPI